MHTEYIMIIILISMIYDVSNVYQHSVFNINIEVFNQKIIHYTQSLKHLYKTYLKYPFLLIYIKCNKRPNYTIHSLD